MKVRGQNELKVNHHNYPIIKTKQDNKGMQIHLIAMGNRMPNWVYQGVEEFVKRMPPECKQNWIEIPAGKRSKTTDINRLMQQEGEKMLATIPKGAMVVALDVKGKSLSTEELSQQLD